MDWNTVGNFIRPELLIIGAFLYCVGMLLKLLPSFTTEWQIPFIVTAVSLLVTPIYTALVLGLGWAPEMMVSAVIQAVLLSALCVFANQIYKQLTSGRAADREE